MKRKPKTKRQRLLARVHILAKEIWPQSTDDMRREWLMYNFGIRSVAGLGVAELDGVVEAMGARKKAQGSRPKGRSKGGRLESLRGQARATARELGWSDKRLRGLCRKCCGCDRLEWVRDISRLTALVKALERYLRREFRRQAPG